jgi:hypothetical protein
MTDAVDSVIAAVDLEADLAAAKDRRSRLAAGWQERREQVYRRHLIAALEALKPLNRAAQELRPWPKGIGPEPPEGVWTADLTREDAHRAARIFAVPAAPKSGNADVDPRS